MATPSKVGTYAYGVPVHQNGNNVNNNNINIVSDVFCVPYQIDLIVKKKVTGLIDASFDVMDVNGNLLLRVEGASKTVQKKRILRDPAGFPILTMREKVLTLHHRWTVHRGESSDQRELIFTVQRSSALQIRTKLDVFLSSNFSKDVSDLQVIGNHSDGSAKVFRGGSLIAEVADRSTFGGFFEGKEDFGVRIYPCVDYAFVVALLVVFNEIDGVI